MSSGCYVAELEIAGQVCRVRIEADEWKPVPGKGRDFFRDGRRVCRLPETVVSLNRLGPSGKAAFADADDGSSFL